MLKSVLAASVALLCCAPAQSMVIQLRGVVDHQMFPGVDPFVALGDIVTVTFDFDPATQSRDDDRAPGAFAFDPHSKQFKVETSRGLSWKAADEINDNGIFLYVDDHYRPTGLDAYLNRPSTDRLPNIYVTASSFRIDSGGTWYGNTTPSLGFSGSLAPVPEPTTWVYLIAGFGMIGLARRVPAAVRQKRAAEQIV